MVQPKAGPYTEVLNGQKTGREYVIAELSNGHLVCIFTDGTREPAPKYLSPIYIDDGIRYGTLVTVTQ